MRAFCNFAARSDSDRIAQSCASRDGSRHAGHNKFVGPTMGLASLPISLTLNMLSMLNFSEKAFARQGLVQPLSLKSEPMGPIIRSTKQNYMQRSLKAAPMPKQNSYSAVLNLIKIPNECRGNLLPLTEGCAAALHILHFKSQAPA